MVECKLFTSSMNIIFLIVILMQCASSVSLVLKKALHLGKWRKWTGYEIDVHKEKGINGDSADDGEIKIIGRLNRHVDKSFQGYVSSKKGTTKSRKASLHIVMWIPFRARRCCGVK